MKHYANILSILTPVLQEPQFSHKKSWLVVHIILVCSRKFHQLTELQCSITDHVGMVQWHRGGALTSQLGGCEFDPM